jgi:hypothetical protein
MRDDDDNVRSWRNSNSVHTLLDPMTFQLIIEGLKRFKMQLLLLFLIPNCVALTRKSQPEVGSAERVGV